MAGVRSLEVYEVEIEESYDGMFWPELDGSRPDKTSFYNIHLSLPLKSL